MFYVGLAKAGRVPDPVPDQNGGDAVHRGVLDTGIRRVGRGRLPGMAGECARHQESTGAEKRCAGKPMAIEAAHLWIAEEVVSADAGNTCLANVLAGTGRVRPASRNLHSAHAQGADGDERAIGDRAQRPEWSYRHEHSAVDRGRRAGWQPASRVPRCAGESQSGDDCQKPGRDVAARTVGDSPAAIGRLGPCAATDSGLRSGSTSNDEADTGCLGSAEPASRGYRPQAPQARTEEEWKVVPQ